MKKHLIDSVDKLVRLFHDLKRYVSDGVVLELTVEQYDPARTIPQNDHIHPLVRQIKRHLERSGATERPEEWWRGYLVAEYAGQEVIPSRHEPGKYVVVNKLGGTSAMKKVEASEFIEWLYAFGSSIGVEWEQ